MNFNTINKKNLNSKQSNNDKIVNTYYYKGKEENKENQDDNENENMTEFINRIQSKKGDKIFGSYKKSHYLNNQYSIERYYKYNKIVNRIKKEDEQIKKQNQFYSSPLQNLDSSESDSLFKKQKHKTHTKERPHSPTRKKKDKKNVEESKPVADAPPTPKYNDRNHNNTIFNQTVLYNNNDLITNKSNYLSPPISPVSVTNNHDYS
ncbi:hypothetical protein PIROE2DRAFT_7206, partial [Piromyces sp. E2]